jgi:hypothetical protein
LNGPELVVTFALSFQNHTTLWCKELKKALLPMFRAHTRVDWPRQQLRVVPAQAASGKSLPRLSDAEVSPVLEGTEMYVISFFFEKPNALIILSPRNVFSCNHLIFLMDACCMNSQATQSSSFV